MTPISRATLLRELVEGVQARRTCRAFYVNAHGLRSAQRDRELQNVLNRAHLVYCDGYGVMLVARIVGTRLPARMTPPDWIDEFLQELARVGGKVALVGDEPGVAEACARRMISRHKGLQIVSVHHGFFEVDGPENETIVSTLARSGADVVLVGMGSPRQEIWAARNHEALGVPCLITVGALFRYYAGIDQRAPQWMTDNGLEWLGRLSRHPIRHFDRYVIGLPNLMVRALATRLRKGRGG